MPNATLRQIQELEADLASIGVKVKCTVTFTGMEIESASYVDRLIARKEAVKRGYHFHSHYSPIIPMPIKPKRKRIRQIK